MDDRIIRGVNNTVFVVGSARSGTTLFRLILDSHPKIVSPGEYDFLFDFAGEDVKSPEVDKYIHYLSTNRIFLSRNLTIDPNLGRCALVKSFVRQETRAGRILAMNIQRGYQQIPSLFAEAKFIHLVRDPRDVALSVINMGWAGNAYSAVDRWIETEGSWNKLASKIEPTNILEIKYEDLTAKPQQTLRVVCRFLSIDFDETMLQYFQRSTYDPIHQMSVRKWEGKIPPDELAVLEHKVSDLLVNRGYDLSGQPIRPPSARERAFLCVNNKIYQWQFAAKRYGPSLFLTEKFARFFRINSLHRRTRLAINEVDKMHLQ